MERRDFLAGTLAASALTMAPGAGAQTPDSNSKQREYYQIRRYYMQSGSQTSPPTQE